MIDIRLGDCRYVLASLPAGVARTCITSPPYYGLRDYGVAGQIGQEQTPDAYVAELVAVFREVRRVLADNGTVWLNIGDSYASDGPKVNRSGLGASGLKRNVGNEDTRLRCLAENKVARGRLPNVTHGAKSKDLLMIPSRVALALQADGWWLRSQIVWHKPNPMPESVRDRPTSAWESVFLLAKSERYYYDADAVREPATCFGRQRTSAIQPPKVLALQKSGAHGKGGDLSVNYERQHRNLRNVWVIAPKPYSGAHFAVMPPDLVATCIKAGSAPGDTVLDPFFGAGTVGLVASGLGRKCIGIELNPEYVELARERLGLAAAA